MKTYWTSGVMVEVSPREGEKVYYAKVEVDAVIARLERDLRALSAACDRCGIVVEDWGEGMGGDAVLDRMVR